MVGHVRRSPLLIILSGPSGVGKDAIVNRMRILDVPMHFTVTATTRAIRPNEQEGVDYTFLSAKTFDEMREQREFLECAEVYGNWYGVPKSQVTNAMQSGMDVLIKADVQGAATIKGLVPEAVFIFLMPPSREELERRLRERKTETTTDLELRIRTAMDELNQLPLFDFVVVNDQLEAAASRIDAIVTAEKCRIPSRRVQL